LRVKGIKLCIILKGRVSTDKDYIYLTQRRETRIRLFGESGDPTRYIRGAVFCEYLREYQLHSASVLDFIFTLISEL